MRTLPEAVIWWAVLTLVWLATLGTVSAEELAVAGGAAAFGAAMACWGRRVVQGQWHIQAGWIRGLLVLPWAVLHDMVVVLRLVLHPARKAEGEFREIPLAADRARARRSAREAVATMMISATPGSLVVDGADRDQHLVIHTLPGGDTTVQRAVRR